MKYHLRRNGLPQSSLQKKANRRKKKNRGKLGSSIEACKTAENGIRFPACLTEPAGENAGPPTTQKPDDSANQDNETPPPKVPETPEPEKPEESEPAESSKPKFNINDWITFTKSYAGEVGLILNSEAVECWDNPIPANENSTTLEQSIKSRLNLYARNGDITDVWVWAVEIAPNSYEIYIGYA